MEAERPAGRFAAVLVVLAALIFAVATIHAAFAGDAGRTILGGGAAAIEAVIALGGAVLAAAGAALASARGFALAAAALWLLWLVRQPIARRGAQPLLAAIALGWVAQSFLLAEQVALGTALYALAAAAVWLAPPPSPDAGRSSSRLTLVWLGLLLGVFAAVCLYRLEVFPNLYVDEMAYLRSARMFAGQIEVGRILGRGAYELYVYDQFAAQTVPIALQAAAISALPSDVIATRLLSVLAVAAALVLAVLTLRRPLGDRAVVWMLALGVASPLLVVYSRAGFYISVSVLHAGAAFAALLWLYRRWDLRAAVVVGVLLGASLYQYQLSWFVPVFAACGFAAMPELWRRAGVGRVVVAVAISGGLTVLPAFLWLDTGIDAVNAQTFDRAVWNAPGPGAPASPHETWTGVLAVVPESVAASELDAFVAQVAERGLTPTRDHTPRADRIVWIGGTRPEVEGVVAEIRRDRTDWLLLDFDWINKNPLDRFRRMLSQLFYESSWESSGRWIDGPLFNPALAPLVVVGLAVLWRRRSEPALRLLGIWVVGGALLPAVFGGPAPRRTSLMLPFVYAVMALPLVELGSGLARRSARLRAAGAALGVAVAVVAIATGSHLYFRSWEQQAGQPGGGGELLDYVKVLKTRPEDETVVSPAMYRGLESYLDAGDASRFWPELETRQLRKRPLFAVRELSCAQPPPFTWVARDIPEHHDALEFVAKYFALESDDQAGFLVRRVTAAHGGLCSTRPAARPAEQQRSR